MKLRHAANLAYPGATVALGAAVIVLSVYRLLAGGVSYQWLILAYLTVLSGAFTIKIAGCNSKFSVADTFIFINTILFGTAAGALTAALDGFVGSMQAETRSRRKRAALFNTAVMAVSVFAAGEVFFYIFGHEPLSKARSIGVVELAVPAALSALVYFLCNSFFVAGMVSLANGESMFRIWRRGFVRTSVIFLASAAAGALVAFVIRSITPLTLLVVVPILVIAYLLDRVYIGPDGAGTVLSENGPVTVRPAYRRYHYFMVALGLGFIALLLHEVFRDGTGYQWVILASLAVFAGFVTVKIPGIKIKFSLADSFVFANIILFGPVAGAITAAIDGLAGSLRCRTRARRVEFTLFNMAATTLPAYIAGEMFFGILGQRPIYEGQVPVGSFFPVMMLAISYYLLNSTSVAIIVALQAKERVSRIWRENLLWGLMPPIACALGALFVAAGIQAMTPGMAAAVLTMLAAIYVTHKAAVARVPQRVPPVWAG